MNIKTFSLSAILFSSLLLSGLARADHLDEKLAQCKKEFAISHNKNSTQAVAVAAKLKHLKLMKEILHELNMKNQGKNLSNKELQDNVMVMSHLLEMLVEENLAQKDETWNYNY